MNRGCTKKTVYAKHMQITQPTVLGVSEKTANISAHRVFNVCEAGCESAVENQEKTTISSTHLWGKYRLEKLL